MVREKRSPVAWPPSPASQGGPLPKEIGRTMTRPHLAPQLDLRRTNMGTLFLTSPWTRSPIRASRGPVNPRQDSSRIPSWPCRNRPRIVDPRNPPKAPNRSHENRSGWLHLLWIRLVVHHSRQTKIRSQPHGKRKTAATPPTLSFGTGGVPSRKTRTELGPLTLNGKS